MAWRDAQGNIIKNPGKMGNLPPLELESVTQQGARYVAKGKKGNDVITEAVAKDAALRATKLKELSKVVDFFEQKINEIPGGSGIGGKMMGGRNIIESILQTNPKTAAYQADLEGMKALIARGLGDVGNLSEVEQENAVKLLPKITDNLETRKQKLDNFRDLMEIKGLESALKDDKHVASKKGKVKIEW